MNLVFHKKKITGIMTILPKNEVNFDDEIENYDFSKEKSIKLKKIMGYNKHRIAEENVSASDLCVYGLDYLIKNKFLEKDEIDAVLFVSQSPDHFIPPTSNIIQGKLGLKHDIICLDINQGCAGYLVGLMQAFMLLDLEPVRKVILINADVLSKKVSKKDRNSYPLIGDAASITIIERVTEENPIYMNLKMDGSRSEALIIPAGGFRMPSTSETSILKDIGDGNLRSKDNLTMDGTAIFNFVQVKVPPMIENLLEFSGERKENIDYFMFHQPNKFMLEKLADKMNICYEKMPNNIVENFGNSSGVTIPVNITFNLGARLTASSAKLCLAGFGSGLTWSSMILNLGRLDFCKIITY